MLFNLCLPQTHLLTLSLSHSTSTKPRSRYVDKEAFDLGFPSPHLLACSPSALYSTVSEKMEQAEDHEEEDEMSRLERSYPRTIRYCHAGNAGFV